MISPEVELAINAVVAIFNTVAFSREMSREYPRTRYVLFHALLAIVAAILVGINIQHLKGVTR